MGKLTELRRRILAEVDDAAQAHRIAKRLSIATTTASGALQWARRSGLATWASRWELTDAGRRALSEEANDG